VADEWRPWEPCRENVRKPSRHDIPDSNPTNRMELARMRAGLSPTQAAQMLDLERDELLAMERQPTIDSEWNTKLFAAYYGVSVEWLTGQVPRYNYEPLKDIPGYDELSPMDRDTLAEFTASLPPSMAFENRARLRKP